MSDPSDTAAAPVAVAPRRPAEPAEPFVARRGVLGMIAANADVVAVVAGATIVATILLYSIAHNEISDMPDHATMAAVGVQHGVLYAHPLFFALVAALAGWTTDRAAILDVIPFVLGVAFAVSVTLAILLVRERVGAPALAQLHARHAAVRWGVLASVVAVFFSFSLPTTTIYIGQFPPMVWHNSTIIFMTPLALGLFIVSLRYLRAPKASTAAWIAVLVTLGVAAKPSFVMAWIPAFPLYALFVAWRDGRDRRIVLTAVGLAAFGGVLLAVQSRYLFSSGVQALNRDASSLIGYPIGTSGLELAPLKVWKLFTPLPIVSVLASNLLTIAGLEVYRGRLLRSPLFQFGAFLYVPGVAIFALFALKGAALGYGDLIWQMVPITLIVFLSVVAEAWRTIAERGRAVAGDYVVLAALAIQVVALVHYLDHYFSAGTFI
jgi:hypothetical protein